MEKINYNQSISNNNVIIWAMLFSAVNIYFLINTRPPLNIRNLNPIAEIGQVESEVMHKIYGSLTWGQPKNGEPLFIGDEIFTGDHSEVVINFKKNGMKLRLAPNSLIRIEQTLDPIIEVKLGDAIVENQQKAKVQIKTASKIIELTSDPDSKIKISSIGENLGIQSLQGKTISAGKEIPVELLSIESLEKSLPSLPQITFPVSGQIIFQNTPGSKIIVAESLQWKNSKKIYKLQLSTDENFTNLIPTTIKGLPLNLGELPMGIYYLRLSTGEQSSFPIKFSVKNDARFESLHPENDSSIIIPRAGNIKLSWVTSKPLSSDLIIENLNNNRVVEIKSQKYESIFSPPEAGKYRWKLTGKIKEQRITETEDQFFDVSYEPIGSLLGPQKNVFKSEELKTLNFQWAKFKNEAFNVELLDSKNNRIIDQVTQLDSFTWEYPEPGKYKLRLASQTYQSKTTFEFPFSIQAPLLQWLPFKKRLESTDPEISFKLPVKVYLNNKVGVELYRPGTSSGKEIKRDSIVKLNDPGEYCLRASGPIDSLSYFPEPLCFEFINLLPFTDLPKLNDQILKSGKEDESLFYFLKSPDVKNATLYEFSVYKDAEKRNLVFNSKESRPETKWKTNRSGVYYLTYKVYDKYGRSSLESEAAKIFFPVSPLSEW